jgi:hypothetical protein
MTASITLVGRVVTPPAAVFYESGTVRVTLSLTITRRRFAEEEARFHLELWGKQAQRAHDELHVGALIGVIGDVRIRDGQPWVLVDRFELLGEPRSDSTPADSAINTFGSPTAAEVT